MPDDSDITLTPAGYGDILPATVHAQSFAAVGAVIGTDYSVLLMSRLVGMQAAQQL